MATTVVEWQLKNQHKVLQPADILLAPSSISRKNLEVPNSRIFLLNNFLSPEECSYYIKESQRLQYESLEKEFHTKYRNNERCSCVGEETAKILWDRVRGLLRKEDIDDIRPFGWGTDGTWKPIGLDIWFKFSRYNTDTFFKPHFDTPYVKSDDERSIFTLMVFLNDDFEGGTTNFLTLHSSTDVLKDTPPQDVICSVLPKTGCAIIFNHDTRHEGTKVTKGVKYIMRTEIVFKRIEKVDSNWKEEPEFKRCVQLYKDSEKLEAEGNVEGSSAAFLEALALQASKQSSIPKSTQSDQVSWFIADVAANIFEQLSLFELSSVMLVSKSWLKMIRDGRIWMQLYSNRWPEVFKLELTVKEINQSFMKDWYNLYRQLHIAQTSQKTLCIDMGKHYTKFSMTGELQPEPILSIVGKKIITHFSTPGLSEDNQWRVGDDFNCSNVSRPFANGQITDFEAMMRIWKWIFNEGFSDQHIPGENTVLVAEPIMGFEQGHKDMISEALSQLGVPFVHFADSAVLSLAATGSNTGVVVHSGDTVTAVVPVWNGIPLAKALYPIAGKDVTDFLIKNSDLQLEALSESEQDRVTRSIKPDCFVVLNFQEEIKKYLLHPVLSRNLGAEQIRAPEIMFQPSLGGYDCPSIVQFTNETIMKCDEDKRAALFKHVILSGGNTLFAGFDSRFDQEMRTLNPEFVGLQLTSDRANLVVIGGSVIASLSNFCGKLNVI